MSRKMLSKFSILYITVVLASISLVLSFANASFRSVLISEKQSAMQKEAKLIARQYARDYFSGDMTTKRLSQYFSELDSLLNAEVWLCSKDGNIVATSAEEDDELIYQNIKDIVSSVDLERTFRTTGNFSDSFDEEMISTGRPISLSGELVGYIILHSPISTLSSTQDGIAKTVYVSLGILLIVILILLSYFSRRILIPLDKINYAARQYAKGNFGTLIPINRNDEIGQLASSLNFMAAELSKTEEYRKDFISNISHDFRSPLTSIKGYLEAILDGTIPPELYKRYLSVLLDETKRLTKLTEGLISLKTLNGYGPLLNSTDFDIIKIVQSTMNTFEGQCSTKRIEMMFQTNLETCLVHGDKTKIEQVVYNLIDNAIKFSKPDGNIKITITELGHNKISVSVKDKGIGIPRSEQSHIWERFYKVDNSRGKDKQSHGIGLAITREIIHAHKEQINLISTENVGSEFVFTLTKSPSK